MDLTEEQRKVVEYSGEKNIIISACAGSGKTTVLVNRLKKEFESYNGHKKILLLTTTNSVKKELQDRINEIGVEIETFHSFLIKNILKFKNKNELKILYNIKIETFEEWVEEFENKNIITGTINSPDDFLLDYGMKLSGRKHVEQYVKSKYKTVYIDEAQDNNQVKNDVIKKFISLDIKVFMVGDVNQSIFRFAGAKPEIFNSYLTDEKFEKFRLSHNFRCSKEINAFAQGYDFPIDLSGYNNIEYLTGKEILNEVKNNYSSCTVLCRRNDIADEFATNYEFVKIKKPDLKIEYEHEIFIFLKNYFKGKNTIKLLDELNFDVNKNNKDIVNKAYEDNYEDFLNLIGDSNCELREKLTEFINEKEIQDYFNMEESKYKIMTIHTSKGLEYDNVLIFKNNYNLNKEEDKHLFYVACTRARNKLLICN